MASRYLHDHPQSAARLAAGCLPVADVLREADLPADVLESTGLVFHLERRSIWQRTATLSVSLKRWVFGEPWDKSLWIKPGGRAGFLELVQGVLAGQVVVEQLGAAKRQTLAWSLRHKAKRDAHMRLMDSRVPPPLDPAVEAMVAPFLERWTAAARQGMELYDNTDARGLRDLHASGLSVLQRHCILAKLRPGYFVERSGGNDDPDSGLWTFERLLPQQNIRVRAVLRFTADGEAICVRFHRVDGDARHGPPSEPLGVDRSRTCVRTMPFNLEGLALETVVLGHPATVGHGLFSSAAQDIGNITQLYNCYRSCKGYPIPEEFSNFLGPITCARILDAEDLSTVLGWHPQRWGMLCSGALPTEDEVATFRAMADPWPVYRELVVQFPDKYVISDAYVPGNVVDLSRSGPIVPASFNNHPPDVFNGYRWCSEVWAGNLAFCITDYAKPGVQLFWSLLFMCDMHCYALTRRGFTGLRYRATSEGPELLDPGAVLERLRKAQYIRVVRANKAQEPTVYPHRGFYPVEWHIHHKADDIIDALPKDWAHWQPADILARCSACASWSAMVEDHAFVPYDFAFDLLHGPQSE